MKLLVVIKLSALSAVSEVARVSLILYRSAPGAVRLGSTFWLSNNASVSSEEIISSVIINPISVVGVLLYLLTIKDCASICTKCPCTKYAPLFTVTLNPFPTTGTPGVSCKVVTVPLPFVTLNSVLDANLIVVDPPITFETLVYSI